MYGSPTAGYMPKFKPVPKRGRPTFYYKYLRKQAPLFPEIAAPEQTGLTAATVAFMSRIVCEGCEE